jgi:hypothetical protein
MNVLVHITFHYYRSGSAVVILLKILRVKTSTFFKIVERRAQVECGVKKTQDNGFRCEHMVYILTI